MGKAVLVISHDDRYFHLADRLIRMENGQLTFDPTALPTIQSTKALSSLIVANSVA